MRKTITLNVEELNDDIVELRANHFFDKKVDPKDAVDEFDELSFFTTIRLGNTLIGAERITDTTKKSVFSSWLKENDSTPKGEGVYEISRTVIDRAWWGKAMYNILSIFTIRYLREERKAKNLNFIIDMDANLYLHKWIQKIGSEKCGSPCECSDAPCDPLLVQAYTFNPMDDESFRLCQRQADRIEKVKKRMNYEIPSIF